MLPSIHQKFQNNMFYQILSIYAVVTSCKKFEKKKTFESISGNFKQKIRFFKRVFLQNHFVQF